MHRKTRANALVFLLFFSFAGLDLTAELVDTLPRITRLDVKDVLFKQYLADVETGRRAVFSRHPAKTAEELAGEIVLYSYYPAPGDDILLISARCNIPYDTFVTLNRWEHLPVLLPDTPVLLPSMPGIFIPETPASDLERLLFSSRGAQAGVLLTFSHGKGREERFRFIPGDSFTPNERFFFLNPGLFRFPLQQFRLTSPFGMRVSPINGRLRTHDGLDLAAPQGTPVFAARDGTVIETGANATYGNYIIIEHNGSWTSLYGHLSAIDIQANAQVKGGSLIGKVGSTGLSTGPHLHFELRQHGKPQDPRKILQGGGKEKTRG